MRFPGPLLRFSATVFAFDFNSVVVLQVGAGIALLTGLWLYYDRRDRLFYDRTRRLTTYHCLKCNQVYTAAPQAGLVPCPRCGHANPRLHF